MTLTLDLTYTAPTTVDEALAALAAGGAGSVLLAGGTDVVPAMRDDVLAPAHLIDLKRIPGLDTLTVAGDVLRVGCLVTFSDLLDAEVVRDRLPVLVEMAGMVASVGIRNRATLVGNLCSAIPSCDAGPVLLALDAQVHVVGPDGGRSVPIDAWFVGPHRTVLRPDELVTHVDVTLPAPAHGAAFARLSRTRGEDLAQASVAVLLEPGGRTRVAFGSVAPTPLRATRIEALLHDRGVDRDTIAAAVELVPDQIAPITDVRATSRYRLRMCQVMLRRALLAASARAAGDGPAYGTALL